jgi:threonine synthase
VIREKPLWKGSVTLPERRFLFFTRKTAFPAVQELQMVTQLGENVGVLRGKRNFDDAQNGEKRIFFE